MRHFCCSCGETPAMMCVFCPASYCDQHLHGNIKTRYFAVASGGQVRHRVCAAHGNVPSNAANTQQRRPSELEVRSPEDNAQESPLDTAVTDNGGVKENVTDESMTDTSVLLTQNAIGSADNDGKMAAVQELGESNDKVRDVYQSTDEVSGGKRIRLSNHVQPKPVKQTTRCKRETVTGELRKKNGIVLEIGNLSSSQPAPEQDPRDTQIQNERPSSGAEELVELTRSAEKSDNSQCWAPAVNGFRSQGSAITRRRRRSTLLESSQTPNILSDKLGSPADSVTALLGELSESKDVGLLNGKELVVDEN